MLEVHFTEYHRPSFLSFLCSLDWTTVALFPTPEMHCEPTKMPKKGTANYWDLRRASPVKPCSRSLTVANSLAGYDVVEVADNREAEEQHDGSFPSSGERGAG